MKSIDIKSCIIGVLATLLVVVSFGAVGQPSGPRYQIDFSSEGFLVLDHQTQIVTRLAKPIGDKPSFQRPWVTDTRFSLTDALTKPEGAEIHVDTQ
jgi:hypothetical protein